MSNVIPLNNISEEEKFNLEYNVRAQALANVFETNQYVVTCITKDQQVHHYIGEAMDAKEVALLQKYTNSWLDTVL